jgi:hypothetical protein
MKQQHDQAGGNITEGNSSNASGQQGQTAEKTVHPTPAGQPTYEE